MAADLERLGVFDRDEPRAAIDVALDGPRASAGAMTAVTSGSGKEAGAGAEAGAAGKGAGVVTGVVGCVMGRPSTSRRSTVDASGFFTRPKNERRRSFGEVGAERVPSWALCVKGALVLPTSMLVSSSVGTRSSLAGTRSSLAGPWGRSAS